LIFAAINLSAIRLRARIGINMTIPLTGFVLSFSSWAVLFIYLCKTNWRGLAWIGALYLCVIVAEFFFSERKLFFKRGA
jgi:hypothetical protein